MKPEQQQKEDLTIGEQASRKLDELSTNDLEAVSGSGDGTGGGTGTGPGTGGGTGGGGGPHRLA